MSEHELEKLLGGFAADILTQEERQKLFTAALQDQQLFNALTDEQALKELLADPAVRGRLLQALNQPPSSRANATFSWLDWLRRPTTLAYAGGLTVIVLAVVLGTKIYQESLREAGQQPTENAEPAVRSPLKDGEIKEKAAPTVPEKPAADKSTKGEGSAGRPSQEQGSRSARDDRKLRSEQDQVQKQAPAKALGKSAEEGSASGSKQKAESPSQAATPESLELHATAPASEPAASARALFYGQVPESSDIGMFLREEEAKQPYAQSTPEVNRPERNLNRFAPTSKAADVSAQAKPLGLRYSFVIQETNGQEREVDARAAKQHIGQVYLTVEANQNAYLQIWKADAAMPQLLAPQKETGQISVRVAGGQRQRLPLPLERETLVIRASRMPFGPVTRQEGVMLGRLSANQIQETVSGSKTGQQEQATYIVSQDPSPTAQMTAEIRFDQ
jgi:hypothetical protein